MRTHNVFHVLQLDHYTLPVVRQPSSEPHPVIVDHSDKWEVERILDSKQCYRKLHYLVEWAGYSHIHRSWETFQNLENAHELMDEFRRDQPNEPRRWRKSDLGSGGIDRNGEMETRSNWTFPSSLCCRDPVQYIWRQHRFYHLWKSSQLEVEFPCAPEGHPRHTDQLLDLWDCTSVYAGCFLASCVYLAAREFSPERGGWCNGVVKYVQFGLPDSHVSCPVPDNREPYMDIARET